VTGQAWLPQGVDAHRPTDARVHDYALGGKDNYAVDRAYAHRLLALHPALRRPAAESGRFARRAIRHLLDLGVRQFLEIGCGLPRRGDVHHVAGPESAVVYVDYDPVAVSHYQAVLCPNGPVRAIHADATEPQRILSHPVVAEVIDFDRPVGLLMTHVLHLIADDRNPARMLREFGERLAPGSHLVLSHVTLETLSPAEAATLGEVFAELREPVRMRDRDEVTTLFDGFELLDPGVTLAPEWRPDRPYRSPSGWVLAGVGRKA
jgi:SAM-dependent methyltransferase